MYDFYRFLHNWMDILTGRVVLLLVFGDVGLLLKLISAKEWTDCLHQLDARSHSFH